MATKEITLKSGYRWTKLFDYENGKGVTTKETRRYKWKKSLIKKNFVEASSNEAKKISHSAGAKAEASVAWGVVSASVSANYDFSSEVNQTLDHVSKNDSEETYEIEEEISREFVVQPMGRIVCYQLQFTGPGINIQPNIVTTRPKPDPQLEQFIAVEIGCVLKEIKFLKDIKVVTGRREMDTPDDHMPVLWGESPDVNKGFPESNFVWFIPSYSTSTADKDTATAISYVKTKSQDTSINDFSSGDGKEYFRYLRLERNIHIREKIINVKMARTSYRLGLKDARDWGWDGISQDLNEDRGGEYLYLLWDTRNVDLVARV
ncbi:hypothetical protein BDV32DRAFT_15336 [Aspergillus pseudonomiae]|uniref:Uncharacterized protein n=1 Tax=Aspergillus pseudonomiae TaxID=1506151 RepID=A0A5N7CT13_9EURO|nr:uncharacterized protein BDV37DRAFT_289510 [Aspergillus pseudonomiae]KAB8254493.1 hypothetical protein BDV32DRAFT_15336 [Aspergillus pseudonomiae]KAE8397341.1 hypothetical protein BDV37DRAFT_289510 [Aspergillus pseudonomiae]